MSILIKGAKMPKTCEECQSTLGLFADECPLFAEFPKMFDYDPEIGNNRRYDGCPLVEIPPRLIDKDKLEKIFWDILNKPDEYDKPLHDMVLALQTAPTVIESEDDQ